MMQFNCDVYFLYYATMLPELSALVMLSSSVISAEYLGFSKEKNGLS